MARPDAVDAALSTLSDEALVEYFLAQLQERGLRESGSPSMGQQLFVVAEAAVEITVDYV